MTHKIICYGDSNTYGACGFVGGRHAADSRWTGILHDSGLYEVVNLGENGREIPSKRACVPNFSVMRPKSLL